MPSGRASTSLTQWARWIFSPPNLLTLVRVPLAALLWGVQGSAAWTLAILLLGGATDVVDGRVARALRRRRGASDAEARVGAWLDPVCDKIFALVAALVVWQSYAVPLYVVPLVLTRELLLAPLVIYYHLVPALGRGLDFRADEWGKLTTLMQFAVVLCAILEPHLVVPLAAGTAVLGTGVGLHYALRGLHLQSERRPLRRRRERSARTGHEQHAVGRDSA